MPPSNHKALFVPLLLLMAFALTVIAAPEALHAQEQKKAEDPTPPAKEETTENKATEEKEITLIDLIKASRENKGKMRSMDWDTKKYREEVSEEREKEKAELYGEDEAGEDKDTNGKELSEEDKIWRHYNNLANRDISDKGKTDKEPEDKDTTKEDPEEPEEAKNDKENKEDKEPEESNALTDILKRYKESQKKQGPINSRSYGSIE